MNNRFKICSFSTRLICEHLLVSEITSLAHEVSDDTVEAATLVSETYVRIVEICAVLEMIIVD